MPPELSVGDEEDPSAIVGGFVRSITGDVGFRVAALSGAVWAKPSGGWQRERRSATTALIVHLSATVDPMEVRGPGQHVWWGVNELAEHRRSVNPQGIIPFIAGYLEGWLPDGAMRLD